MRSHGTGQAAGAILIVLPGLGFAIWQVALLRTKLKLRGLQQFGHWCCLGGGHKAQQGRQQQGNEKPRGDERLNLSPQCFQPLPVVHHGARN